MLQYIINASAIWLLSLIVYTLILRNESYHGYNRLYLLASLFLGSLLPLIPAGSDSALYTNSYIPKAISDNALILKTNISIQRDTIATDYSFYILLVYIIGVSLALIKLLVSTYQLFRTYRLGNKTKLHNWIIIETGKLAGPYSIFNLLFVSSLSEYTDEELNILLQHEYAHKRLGHFFDVVILEVARIIFWFHPFIYVYDYFIRLNHEYQADRAVSYEPETYGRFLIEQSILSSPSYFTHSFNRSPIKNRIMMLKNKKGNRIKLIATIPLTLVCLLYFTKISFSQKKEIVDGKMSYNGHSIEFIEHPTDTVMVQNPITGDWELKIVKQSATPITIDNKRVFNAEDAGITPPKFIDKKDNLPLDIFIIKAISYGATHLPAGSYNYDVRPILIDEKGRVIFFFEPEMYPKEKLSPDEKEQVKRFAKQTSDIIEKLRFEPAKFHGKNVNYVIPSVYLNDIKIDRK